MEADGLLVVLEARLVIAAADIAPHGEDDQAQDEDGEEAPGDEALERAPSRKIARNVGRSRPRSRIAAPLSRGFGPSHRTSYFRNRI